MVYPMSVNGREGSFYDPWANDQDWGLYFNLKELGAGVFLKKPGPQLILRGNNLRYCAYQIRVSLYG